MKAVITFVNNSQLIVKENDAIIPIVSVTNNGKTFASTGKSFDVYAHAQINLIPALMDALLDCDFFTLASDELTVYNKNHIVSIKSD